MTRCTIQSLLIRNLVEESVIKNHVNDSVAKDTSLKSIYVERHFTIKNSTIFFIPISYDSDKYIFKH